MRVIVIGGGLAGSEAALQISRFGIPVLLYEMRPNRTTPAHRTELFAELVCSNSFKSQEINNSHGLLKRELKILGSILLSIAERTRLPAGKALAVDRRRFSETVTNLIERNPLIEIRREEVTDLPVESAILATGPLTSDRLAQALKKLIGDENFYFYDAIAPIIAGDSINWEKTFRGSRYGVDKSYINCPMDRATYEHLVQELKKGAVYPLHHFEDPKYFEGCLPIEELARRGIDTLRFGPLKPVGFQGNHYAIVQLRPEDSEGRMYSLVGFQTRLLIPEQRRIFRMIPGLSKARFLRYGVVHRNSYINGPKHLLKTLQLKEKPDLLIAGQLTGTEGYVEAMATGLIAGVNLARMMRSRPPLSPPLETMLGALIDYITTPNEDFQPMNANFGLLPGSRRRVKVSCAIRSMENWQEAFLNI